jgi:hypothetical protein
MAGTVGFDWKRSPHFLISQLQHRLSFFVSVIALGMGTASVFHINRHANIPSENIARSPMAHFGMACIWEDLQRYCGSYCERPVGD